MDAHAEEWLRAGRTSGSISAEHITLSDDGYFYSLWDTGLFTNINTACSIEIDEYEDAVLPPARSVFAIQAIRITKLKSDDQRFFANNLVAMIERASKDGFGVYFIL